MCLRKQEKIPAMWVARSVHSDVKPAGWDNTRSLLTVQEQQNKNTRKKAVWVANWWQSLQRHRFPSSRDTRSTMGRRGHNGPFMLSGSAVEKTRAALWLQGKKNASPGGIPRCLRSAATQNTLFFLFGARRGKIYSRTWCTKSHKVQIMSVESFPACIRFKAVRRGCVCSELRVSALLDQSNKVHKRCIITARACDHSHFNITQLWDEEKSKDGEDNNQKFYLSVSSWHLLWEQEVK